MKRMFLTVILLALSQGCSAMYPYNGNRATVPYPETDEEERMEKERSDADYPGERTDTLLNQMIKYQ